MKTLAEKQKEEDRADKLLVRVCIIGLLVFEYGLWVLLDSPRWRTTESITSLCIGGIIEARVAWLKPTWITRIVAGLIVCLIFTTILVLIKLSSKNWLAF